MNGYKTAAMLGHLINIAKEFATISVSEDGVHVSEYYLGMLADVLDVQVFTTKRFSDMYPYCHQLICNGIKFFAISENANPDFAAWYETSLTKNQLESFTHVVKMAFEMCEHLFSVSCDDYPVVSLYTDGMTELLAQLGEEPIMFHYCRTVKQWGVEFQG